MKHYLTNQVNIFFALFVVVFLIIGTFVWQKYPFGVKQYKTITLGMPAAQGADTPTVWAPPYDFVPESSFYVYALGDEPMCLGSDCGTGGHFVECLGGWLAGEIVRTEEFDYGLSEAGVDMSKQKIITIADKDAKIVGIYPGGPHQKSSLYYAQSSGFSFRRYVQNVFRFVAAMVEISANDLTICSLTRFMSATSKQYFSESILAYSKTSNLEVGA
jgi:hypothetical protein